LQAEFEVLFNRTQIPQKNRLTQQVIVGAQPVIAPSLFHYIKGACPLDVSVHPIPATFI